MSPRETIAFLLTAPSKSQAVNGFVGLAGAQMGLKYGFMSLFCIVKGQQEQEIIAELLIYDGRRPLAPLDPVSPLLDASRVPGCRECGGSPCLSFPRAGIPWGWVSPCWISPARPHPIPWGDPWGHPWGGRASPGRDVHPGVHPAWPCGRRGQGRPRELRSHALLIPPGTCPSSRRLRASKGTN